MGDYNELYEFAVVLSTIQGVYKNPINFVD